MDRPNADIRLDSNPAARPAPVKERPESRHFRIALLGDFSGRASRGIALRPKLTGVKPVSIDPDNFEQLMKHMGVEVHVAENASIRFTTLDDFHPDEIFTRSSIFDAVRQARSELKKPVTAIPDKPIAPERPPLSTTPGLSLLDAIVEGASSAPSKPRDLWGEAIQAIVAPHVIPKPDPGQAQVKARLDSLAAEMMRVILENPNFQALEAAWRSIFFLLCHLETSENLRIELIDITRDEMINDVLSGSDIHSTGLWRLLVDESATTPWSVAAGLFTFDASAKECEALRRIAQIAKSAGAAFIAAAHSRLAGCESIAATPDPDDWNMQKLETERAEAWQRLRSIPEASWLGLAMPRFLLRLPYGASTSTVESFDFEEMPDGAEHDRYIWGNPAIACVCLLGEAFQAQGARMRAGSVNQIEGIPIHCFGDGQMTPPAEVWMTERVAEALLERGVMPLASVKNSDSIQLVSLRSIALPGAALSGFWNAPDAT